MKPIFLYNLEFNLNLKKMRMINYIFVITIFSWLGCNKNNDNNQDITPSNLIVNIEIAGSSSTNPNGDGTGNIHISAKADNAKNYKILIGEDLFENTDGIVDYTCPDKGLQTYKVSVSAYNNSKFISETKEISVYKEGKLVWSEEFNYTGSPDKNKWTMEIGNGDGGWGNNEKQYYTDRIENATVSNGTLKINAIKENYSGFKYTSSRMITKGKFDFKYGHIDFRAKIPSGIGTWPALWMLGNDIGTVGWPACGEIDVMEHVGRYLNKIYGSLHHPGHSGGNPDGGTVMINDVTSDFHIFSLDWDSQYIKFYVDNNLYYTFNNSATVPFNHNFFVIINFAMGGNFGGDIDPSFEKATFEVDYVRVYQ